MTGDLRRHEDGGCTVFKQVELALHLALAPPLVPVPDLGRGGLRVEG